MILVSVGSSQFPYDRLLRAVESLATTEPVVVQHGPSSIRPRGAECHAYLPVDELARLIRSARVVVCHAGVGSILLALANGKRPCVTPRLSRFGETVDDHQVASARKFASAGLVTLVEDPADLAGVVRDSRPDVAPIGDGSALATELQTYLVETIGSPGKRRP